MEVLSAEDIGRFQNWTCLIYSEPGKGKTSMVKSLTGKTLLLSVDGMIHVLSGLKNVSIIKMNPKQASKELENFYRYF